MPIWGCCGYGFGVLWVFYVGAPPPPHTHGDAVGHEGVGVHEGDELVQQVGLALEQLRRQLLHHLLQVLRRERRHSVPRLRFTPKDKKGVREPPKPPRTRRGMWGGEKAWRSAARNGKGGKEHPKNFTPHPREANSAPKSSTHILSLALWGQQHPKKLTPHPWEANSTPKSSPCVLSLTLWGQKHHKKPHPHLEFDSMGSRAPQKPHPTSLGGQQHPKNLPLPLEF